MNTDKPVLSGNHCGMANRPLITSLAINVQYPKPDKLTSNFFYLFLCQKE